MTICVSVKLRDGIVLGTDSMTQIQAPASPGGAPVVLKAYQNARKLFRVGTLPIGVEVWGIGNFGERTIESLMLEFGPTCSQTTVKGVADEFYAFIQPKYAALFGALSPPTQPTIGFFLAGYSDAQPLAEEWEFVLPKDAQPRAVRPNTVFGAAWRGIEFPFTRLFFGYDGRIREELAKLGVSPQIYSAGRFQSKFED